MKISAFLRGMHPWMLRHAGWWLAGSAAVHGLTVIATRPDMLDLQVYYAASPQVLSGQLYDYSLHPGGPLTSLPFTYPPFAALLFLPLSLLPWAAAACLWQLMSVAALFLIVGCTGRLLFGGAGRMSREQVMVWVGACLWLEPVRHTLDLGQVNLILGALVLWSLTTSLGAGTRGAAVGVAAGVKLTPAIGGLYLLATRQWRAAAWSLVAFSGTVALAWLVVPRDSARYWYTLVGNPDRMGRVSSVRNQSVRGALSRTLGHDVAYGPTWWTAAAVVAVAAGCAVWAAARRRDRLGILVTVQLAGLLLSPISWSHHWIWCVPAMIWLAHGPCRQRLLSRVTLAAWTIATVARVVPYLTRIQESLPGDRVYPARLALFGWVYALCSVLTLLGRQQPAVVPVPDRITQAGYVEGHGGRTHTVRL
ncbi:glycosyltransferase 87 family protein, partial [Streptomyces sp. NPDC005408]|uniref:glycosyltransferase 87 family protein n=1 Tax=Streptomyces sp. NPDC005408 TaxID=3155341 RepID=UPI0033BF8956